MIDRHTFSDGDYLDPALRYDYKLSRQAAELMRDPSKLVSTAAAH